MKKLMDKLDQKQFDNAMAEYRNEVLEEAARAADKTADKLIIGKQRIGCILAGKSIRELKTKLES